jgi:hypothetical protein
LVNRAAQGATPQLAFQSTFNPLSCDLQVATNCIRTGCSSTVENCGASRAANPDIWIYNEIAGIRQCQHQTLDELDRKLARMNGLLDMIMFHVGDGPNVPRVLSQGIAGVLPRLFALEVFFPRVLLRNPDCVESTALAARVTCSIQGLITMRF